MIDPLILRNDVFAILNQHIGTYSLNGVTTEAIACLPDPDKGWNYPENGTKTSGLEVVIKQPYPDVSANLGGDRTSEYYWEIHLKQWDTTKSLVDAISLLIEKMPADYLVERTSIMPASDKLLTVEQCKIFIKEWSVISN
ncbi:hypothetical protein ACE1AT_04720 [Pelatocladus sp. BLCC-F211]|uniref:hypothetical protein n=1 Tax=Pelatocladus sp. BLCC-F211 TaxID=3342752 RepID=UPI0035B9AE5A